MNKELILKIAGVSTIVIGSVCLFLSGAGESLVTALVGGIFVVAAMILGFFKK